jgi:phospholipase C
VYDLKHLARIPRRYTVEAGKSLADEWDVKEDNGAYDLEVYGTNGYFHRFTGNTNTQEPEITLKYNHRKGGISVKMHNPGNVAIDINIVDNAYGYDVPQPFQLAAGKTKKEEWLLGNSGNWYDFSVQSGNDYLHRFAGRVETGKHSISDPAMGIGRFEI